MRRSVSMCASLCGVAARSHAHGVVALGGRETSGGGRRSQSGAAARPERRPAQWRPACARACGFARALQSGAGSSEVFAPRGRTAVCTPGRPPAGACPPEPALSVPVARVCGGWWVSCGLCWRPCSLRQGAGSWLSGAVHGSAVAATSPRIAAARRVAHRDGPRLRRKDEVKRARRLTGERVAHGLVDEGLAVCGRWGRRRAASVARLACSRIAEGACPHPWRGLAIC